MEIDVISRTRHPGIGTFMKRYLEQPGELESPEVLLV